LKGIKRRAEGIAKMLEAGYKLDSKNRLVHRVVCRQANGPFPVQWIVHHVDGRPGNNEPANLIAMPRDLHHRLHKIMKRDRIVLDREYIQKALSLYRPPERKGNPRGKKKGLSLPSYSLDGLMVACQLPIVEKHPGKSISYMKRHGRC
jgi:hypothetical protein